MGNEGKGLTENRKGNEGERLKQKPPLPDSGKYLVEDVAEMLGYESPEYFRKQLNADPTIRKIVWGSKVIIDMAWLWDDLLKPRNDSDASVKLPSAKNAKSVAGKPRRVG